ncbi:MAG: hypothetical protein HUU20_04425 [Pirellulales bacterium]|nr:hypothetical protein [Pirellulales bacterium]
MRTSISTVILIAGLASTAAQAADSDVATRLADLRAVGPEAAGHREAAAAWQGIAAESPAALPAILAGMDGAGPLAANWIATAAQAVVERRLQKGGSFPSAELERFVLERNHSSRARRLAYEFVLRVDPKAEQRLVPQMLDDPSLELRRDAVDRIIGEAAAAAESGKSEPAVALYRQALQAARDLDQVQLLAQRLRKLGQSVDLARQLGYLVRWKLIGPFDNTERKGFDAVYPPEREIRADAAYPGKQVEVRWVEFAAEDDFGKIDFFKPFGQHREVAGYAVTEFIADRRREVEFRMSSFNATKLWLNGKLVDQYPVYHSGSQPDQYVNRVLLEPGRNVILVKVCQNEQTQDWAQRWDFQLRVCDEIGGAVLSADRDVK